MDPVLVIILIGALVGPAVIFILKGIIITMCASVVASSLSSCQCQARGTCARCQE